MDVAEEISAMMRIRRDSPSGKWDADWFCMMARGLASLEHAKTGDLDKLKSSLDGWLGSSEPAEADGSTPLWVAARHGRADCVAHLVEWGMDRKGRMKDGATPLMAAAWAGSPECVELLLPVSDPMAVTKETRMDALMHAADGGSLSCCRLLIGVSDVAKRDWQGSDALMMAANGGSVRVVELLLPHFDPEEANAQGLTALMVARKHSKAGVAELLEACALARNERESLAVAAESAGPKTIRRSSI